MFIFLGFEDIYNEITLEPTIKGGYFVLYNANKFVQHKKNPTTEDAYYRCYHYKTHK